MGKGETQEMTKDESEKDKEVEFYSAALYGWYETRLEHDKSLLTLSAGGIGLLATILITNGVGSTKTLILYVLALLFFFTCLLVVLFIFKQNSVYLEKVINKTALPNDALLSKLDSTALYSFIAAAIFSVIIGVSAAVDSYSNGRNAMISRCTHDSFSGVKKMEQPEDLTRSFNGVVNNQPQGSSSSTSSGSNSSSESSNQTNKKN